jgi:rhamnulokinase
MPSRLVAYCKKTGQTPPADEGALVRCCLDSLALKYRWTIERLESIVGTTIKTIHVVGGGSKNTLLCQLAADACGRPVVAGPVEATAIGNILMQAIGRGKLGSVADLRAVVARSFPVSVFEPRDTAAWDDAAGRFDALVS